ncbi:hypothetical protein ACHAPU_004318 [Fusarium lateritium]
MTRLIVIPDPMTTIVVTQHVPAGPTQATEPNSLPVATSAPSVDSVPVSSPDDGPVFASLIIPTSQEINPVPTITPGEESAPGGEAAPATSDAALNQTAPPIVPVAQPAPQASQEITPPVEPIAQPTEGLPQEITSPIEPIAQPTERLPQEDVPPIVPIAQSTSQEVPQETPEKARLIDGPGLVTTSVQPAIAQSTTQEAPKETPENARLIEVPDSVTTIASPTTQEIPKETPENARLIDGPDSATTNAQPTTQEVPKETPENAQLVGSESKSHSSSSSSSSSSVSSSTSEILVFDTASFTYTGPPSRSTTFQTRPGTKTFTSVTETTEASDSFVFDDGETGVDGSAPSLVTATLLDGSVTTIPLGTAGSGQASETEGPEAVAKDESEGTPPAPIVVGSVIGSILGLSFLALIIVWLVKRRHMKRRRSTLLTPLDLPPNAPGSTRRGGPFGVPDVQEKYQIDNRSLGPTPRSTKVAAAMSASAKKIGRPFRQSMSKFAHPDMDQAQSQMGAESQNMSTRRVHSRVSSAPGQQQGWWSRLIEESSVVDLAEAPPMPENDHDGRRTPSPNPFSDFHSTTSPAHNVSYGYNNHMSLHGSLVPHPLAPAQPLPSDNPFADGDLGFSPEASQLVPIAYRETYKEPAEHQRSPSVQRNLTHQSTSDNLRLVPQEHWRGKVHSNPFDLELHSRHIPSEGNVQQPSRYTAASSFYSTNRQTVRHSRAESYTSKYTSGVSSLNGWPPVPAHPPIPSIYGRYDDNDFLGPHRHSRSESDSGVRRPTGEAM